MICDQGFEHPDPEPEVVIEEAPDLEPVAEAEVRIAEIEANRDIKVAQIEHRAVDEELLAAVAALTAENEALRAQLAPPEPEEIPVVVADPAPEPEAEPDSAPPVVEDTTTSEPKAKARKNPWWG